MHLALMTSFEYEDSVNLGVDTAIEGLAWEIYEMDGTTLYMSGVTESPFDVQMVAESYLLRYEWESTPIEVVLSNDITIELDPAIYIGKVFWEDTLEQLPAGIDIDMLIYNGATWDVAYTFTTTSSGYVVDLPLGLVSINPSNETFVIDTTTPAETEPVSLYLPSTLLVDSTRPCNQVNWEIALDYIFPLFFM